MNPPHIIFTAQEVAELTGIAAYNLAQYHPEDFGSPAYFGYNGHQITYTERGVAQLANELDRRDCRFGAEKLRDELQHRRQKKTQAVQRFVEVARYTQRIFKHQKTETPSRALIPPVRKDGKLWFRQGNLE